MVDRAGTRGLDLFFVSPWLKTSRIVTCRDGGFIWKLDAGYCMEQKQTGIKKVSLSFLFANFEREKSLELSTSTLARLRSTN